MENYSSISFLFSREAASDDDESEVFESLLQDPFFSSSTADEITIVDEEAGFEGREVAEKVDSGENSGAEVEQSDEDSDSLEDDDDNEYDESKKVGTQNSNGPKNPPSEHKCGSRGFRGCDAKCQVEDLTPYQVCKKSYTHVKPIWQIFPPEQQEMHGGILLRQMQVQVNLDWKHLVDNPF